MLRDRFREFFSLWRRRERNADARAEIPAVWPPIRLPKEPRGGAGMPAHTLGTLRARRSAGGSADVFDYLLGFLFIGLLVLGGTLWTSKHGDLAGSGPQFPSPAEWMRRGPTVGTLRAFQWPWHARGQGTVQDIPVPEEPPIAIRVVPAYYTEEARNAGFHGKVFVAIFVDALGAPQGIEPTSPIPFGLELPIRKAIVQWRFQPALTRGIAVASKTVVEVPFR